MTLVFIRFKDGRRVLASEIISYWPASDNSTMILLRNRKAAKYPGPVGDVDRALNQVFR